MKKILAVGLFLCVVVIGVFAGCLGQEGTTIPGTITNSLDSSVDLILENEQGNTVNWHIGAEKSIDRSIGPGSWDVTAKYHSSGAIIDTTAFIVRASDSEFRITISDDSVSATSV